MPTFWSKRRGVLKKRQRVLKIRLLILEFCLRVFLCSWRTEYLNKFLSLCFSVITATSLYSCNNFVFILDAFLFMWQMCGRKYNHVQLKLADNQWVLQMWQNFVCQLKFMDFEVFSSFLYVESYHNACIIEKNNIHVASTYLPCFP